MMAAPVVLKARVALVKAVEPLADLVELVVNPDLEPVALGAVVRDLDRAPVAAAAAAKNLARQAVVAAVALVHRGPEPAAVLHMVAAAHLMPVAGMAGPGLVLVDPVDQAVMAAPAMLL